MANIVITPNRTSGDPVINFTGAGTTSVDITLNVLSNSALSFEGSDGQVLLIDHNLSTGPIFTVNDISGLPQLEVNADGTVRIGEYSDEVFIHAPSTAPVDGNFSNSEYTLWLDESNDEFELKAKKSDGTVINTTIGSGGGTVTGTGTTSYIPKWASSSSLGDSIIRESSSNIGIGITPVGTIHVQSSTSGTVGSIVQGAVSQTANLTEWRNSGATIKAFIDADGDACFGAASFDGGHRFQVGSVSNVLNAAIIYAKLSVDATGTGTVSTPSLYFRGDSNTGIYSISGDELGVTAGGVHKMTIGTSGIQFHSAYTFPSSDGTSNQVLQTNGSGTLAWGTPLSGSGTAETIVKWLTSGTFGDSNIRQSGSNIGIGVAPTCVLDVSGTTSNLGLFLRSGDVSSGVNGGRQIDFGYSGGVSYRHSIKTRHNSTTDDQNAIDFFVWDSSLLIGDVPTNKVLSLDGSGAITFNNIYTFPSADAVGANYILQSDGAGTLSWIATPSGGSGTVTGTGTINTLAMFTGSSAVGNSVITESSGAITFNSVYTFPSTAGTNGQVLEINAGVITWVTPSSGGFTGSGTNDYITKFTGINALGNSVMRESSSKIGVGITPVGTLHVQSNTTGTVSLIAQAVISQTANIFESRVSGGTAFARITKNAEFSNATDSSGSNNEAFGDGALSSITVSSGNTAIGYNALNKVSTTFFCTAVGSEAGYETTAAATGNTYIGYQAGYYNTTGQYNTMLGTTAGRGLSTSIKTGNVCIGYGAGYGIGVADHNVFIGRNAGNGISTGDNNVCIGKEAGKVVGTGANNIIIGYQAADNLTTGSGNIIIAYDINTTAVNTSNELNIGDIIKGNILTGRVQLNPNLGEFSGVEVTAEGNLIVQSYDFNSGSPASPTTPVAGMIVFDDDNKLFKGYDGTSWNTLG
jgi:hypothetical protein